MTDDVTTTGVRVAGRGLREARVGVAADADGATVRADCCRNAEWWCEVRLSYDTLRELIEAVDAEREGG